MPSTAEEYQFIAADATEKSLMTYNCRQVYSILTVVAVLVSITVASEAESPDFPDRVPMVERPFSDDPDKFSFAIIGDKTGGGENKWHVFDRAIAEINALKPDFAIMVGDLIQGYTEDIRKIESEWIEFWGRQSPLEVPFIPLPGNHDITNRVMYDYWVENLGRTYSAFTYKHCLFLLLNTEEWHGLPESGDSAPENWFGDRQIDYALKVLAEHNDVRHTFVMLHKPAWLHEDSGWLEIEAGLAGREYTVFAGHYHNLTLHTRNDRRYFVLGATGGAFTPRASKEFGAFDHYSIVTVDGGDVGVAIIEPGNVHPADISTAEFKEKLASLVTFEPDFKVSRKQPPSRGTIEVRLKNTLENRVKAELAFITDTNWRVTPRIVTLEAQPGEEMRRIVKFSCAADALLPFPTYGYGILYGGERLYGRADIINPVDPTDMHSVKDWMVLGPFDLGVTQKPTTPGEYPAAFTSNFQPRRDTSTYPGKTGQIGWQEYRTGDGLVSLDEAFGEPDWAIGYGVTHIKSPEDRTVLAAVQWNDIGRLFLNGDEPWVQITDNPHLGYVELPLRAGWNTLMTKCANYTGAWSFRIAIENPRNDLQFSSRKE